MAILIVIALNKIDEKNDKRRKDLKYLRKAAEAYTSNHNNNTNRSMISQDSSKFSSYQRIGKAFESRIKSRIYQRKEIRLKSIRKFSPIFWMICILSFIEKMTITPFI